MNVVGGIITYNPDISRLEACIRSVITNVKFVVIIDNGSQNVDQISALSKKFKNEVVVKLLDRNYGIGYAGNVLLHYSEKNGFSWLLCVDQDSVFDEDYVKKLLSMKKPDDTFAICGLPIDQRRIREKKKYEEKGLKRVKECIQSGTLYKVSIAKEIGGFNNWLFIDYVDFEICYRANLNGYSVYQNTKAIFNQEFGVLTQPKLYTLWNTMFMITRFRIFKKLTYTPKIDNWRMYYRVRNRIYCIRKYEYGLQKVREIAWSPILYFKIIFRSNHKLKTFIAICKGSYDGFKEKLVCE